MAKTVADQFAETLAAAGVKRIHGIVGDSLNGLSAKDDAGLIEELHAIVGRSHALTDPESTRRLRTGFRFGSGSAVAVVRPGSLGEQRRVPEACVAAKKIRIMQSAKPRPTSGYA